MPNRVREWIENQTTARKNTTDALARESHNLINIKPLLHLTLFYAEYANSEQNKNVSYTS